MEWLLTILIIPYLIILLFIIYRNLKKIKQFIPASTPSINVSVVIACRNEEKTIPVLLHSLTDQDYPTALFEIIIVDDNSDDNTANLARSFSNGINIKVIDNNGSGKKEALRTGIETAKGELIITTDADCRMGHSWISTISAFYYEKRPDMILCPVRLDPLKGIFGRFQELEFLSLQGITAGSAASHHATMCNGANLAFTPGAYNQNKNNLRFDIATGDDVFLLHSLKKQNNSKILWLESPDCVVVTSPVSTLAEYFNQRRRWISKSTAYDDSFSIILGFTTFLAVFAQVFPLAVSPFDLSFFSIFLSVFVLKSIPDFLILQNTTSRYGRKRLMIWFIPSQIIYPFYVLAVTAYSFLFPQKKPAVSNNERAGQ
jgi:cellulose synthase/poly-beta-1,6-N-acetylglucosamine synthase-like glycosyltransferase